MSWPPATRFKSVVSATAAGGCVLLAITGFAPAQARPTTAALASVAIATEVQAPVPDIHWTRCQQLQCATVKVPLDYDQPDGPTMSLNLVRRLADDQARRIGSLFVNPGGPGGSAADFVGYAAQVLGAPVRARFDVIGIDPRGIAGSTAVVCKAKPGDPALPPRPNVGFPRGKTQIEAWFAYDQAVRDLCAKRANPVIDHMSTADTARDMDLIRQAVGDEMLTYYGISYGTMLGSTYAALFPSRVRAMIVDGVLDPVSWTAGRGHSAERYLVSARLRSGYGAWEALTSAFSECDRVGPKVCPGAGRIGFEWTKVITKLKAGAVRVEGQRVTYADVVGQVLGGLYDRSNYPQIMDFTHALYLAIFSGGRDFAAARAWIELKEAVARTGGPVPRYSTAASVARDRLNPSFEGVLCSDSVNPDNVASAIPSARYADRVGPWFGAAWSWASSICVHWPGSSADAFQGPWRTRTANPILITANMHDPATPISGARAVNRLFPGSVMFTVSTWGHGALDQSRCATTKWDAYLVSGQLPDDGLVCKPDAPLFP